MKLSRRGIRGVGIAYSAFFIGIGIALLMIRNPEVWGLIFGILALIVVTICSYGLGKTFGDLKELSKPARSVRRK